MSEKPITDPHMAFAAALVALAREHGANELEVKFSLTGGKLLFRDDGWDGTRVTFNWSEGRHGVATRYQLRAEASVSIQEPGKTAS